MSIKYIDSTREFDPDLIGDMALEEENPFKRAKTSNIADQVKALFEQAQSLLEHSEKYIEDYSRARREGRFKDFIKLSKNSSNHLIRLDVYIDALRRFYTYDEAVSLGDSLENAYRGISDIQSKVYPDETKERINDEDQESLMSDLSDLALALMSIDEN